MHWAAASRLLGRGGCAKRALAALERQRGAPLNRTPRHKHPHTRGTRAQARVVAPGRRLYFPYAFLSLPLQTLSPKLSWNRLGIKAGQAAAGVILHRAPWIDFLTFLEIIGVCQYFSGRRGAGAESSGFLEPNTPRRKVKPGAKRGGAGTGLGKAVLRSPENVGWRWLGLSADPP